MSRNETYTYAPYRVRIRPPSIPVLNFPDPLPLALIYQSDVLGPIGSALNEQRMRAQPLNQDVVLVRDARDFNFDMVRRYGLADVGGGRPRGGGLGGMDTA